MTTHRERTLGQARADLKRCRHAWSYYPPSATVTGWGVIHCRICGETKIYL